MARLILLVLTIAIATCSFPHILTHIEKELNSVLLKTSQGDFSGAFSRLMVIKLELDELHRNLGFQTHQPAETNLTCTELILQIVTHKKSSKWLENFEYIETRLEQLAGKCTNSDFKMREGDGVDGFNDHCALCVVITRVMENYVEYWQKNVTHFVSKEFCGLFDGTLKPTCLAFINLAGPIIIDSLVSQEPADQACLKLGYCKNPNCTILQKTFPSLLSSPPPAPTKIPSWEWLRHLFVDRFGNQHDPPFDLDNDTFSDISTFRGYNWKGADCNELNPHVYPGRKTGNKMLDHDCNGIFGRAENGKLFEEMYCQKGKRFGVAVLGDSAGAHFSIPEKYFNVSMIQKGTYKDFLARVADELDLPHESGYTGHTQTPYFSHSVYKYLREWNLCNNNDYQNLGVNGGSSGNSEGNIKAMKRNPTEDYPLIIFMELIGNDVCKKSFQSMTTVQQFRRNMLKLLNWIDSTVPPGSHLFAVGLGDGDILYDNLHADMHPLNITYGTLYDFLNCLKISPCWGWLNSNQTVRKFTTERAQNLSKVYQEIIDSTKFKNFDMVYYDFPTMDILNRRIIEGGDPKKMIERCDGFHPSGLFNSYLADWIWGKLRTDHKEWIGQANPFNAEIRSKFNMTVFKDPLHPE